MSARPAICPRFEACDPRCGSRTTLGHLDEVFRYCTSEYESCPVFGGASHDELGGGAVIDAPEHRELGAFRLCDGPLPDDVVASREGEAHQQKHAQIGQSVIELTIGGVGLTNADGSAGNCCGDARIHRVAS